jgi:hypothetical protein
MAIAAAIDEALFDLRTDSSTLKRKASLLLQPFALDAGGYLPGYLAVKSLWRAACRHHFLLASETDTFLMYLRSYLYDDWGLVDALLAPADDELSAAESVLNHLNGRIAEWDNIRSADFSAYEADVAANARRPGGLRIDAAVAQRGEQRLTNLQKELVAAAKGDEALASTIGQWNSSVLQRRQFMNVASAPVEVSFGANSVLEVRWQGRALLRPQAADVMPGRNLPGDAQMEIVFTLRGDRFERAAIVHRQGSLLICAPIGLDEHSDETRQVVGRTFMARPAIMASEAALRAIVEQVISSSGIADAVEHVRAQINTVIDDFFRDTCLRFARDYDAIDACAIAMQARGLKPILGTSALVRGLALLGLATSLNPQTPAVAKIFSAQGLSLDQTLLDLNAQYAMHGYPPQVLATDDSIFTTV